MKKIITALFFITQALIIFAQTELPAMQSRTEVSIRFYDRRVYYPGENAAEPIFLQVSITNNNAETFRFKLADDRSFSMDFSVTNTKNRQLKHTETWLKKRNTNRQIYFREISIEPGETYSFIENLKDYIEITEPGIFLLSGSFFPELKRYSDNSEEHINSNRLSLEIKPAPSAAALGSLPVSQTTGDILQAKQIPPDQVVTYILTARQKSLWEQFFLYLDLEKMITRDPSRNKRFKMESEAGRMNMIEIYKRELSQERVDKEIAVIPVDFKIEHTGYTETLAEVKVIEWFEYRNFKEKKRFTYFLASRDGVWTVYDYVVENLGTE
ncbi:hypothetical protein IFE08_05550 [Treponema pedis]|uniref:Lipoprotein n=3 Tax=Treponema pedis TaxID=409322 RepID=S5ZN13_9SPIR|nr:hypothetical protein [Treponema pedis]AGT43982.1 hypothetical protein TPE_1487 [Treponema pedis str. T A4]QOW61827.1 hypothetical protein IFE08_05550 [Treponema pedis]